uniref:Ig-like domain-containing protein n=1 Tax=Scleropages formosus TaxID=113540 RepID=A0A8C9R1T7_SCLFO
MYHYLIINYFLYFTLDRTWSDEIYQPSSFLAVHLGDTATLECFFSKDERYISWFKQTAAEKPHIIAFTEKYLEPVFYNEFNTSKRFKIQRRDRSNHLMISKTEHSDSAVYYCGRMKDFIMLFGTGTFLSVKGNYFYPVRPGDSVTLQCTVDSETCAGEHSVYWFRHGSGESLPGLIYTHGNRSDECEKSPEAGSHTHGCVYSLPKRNLRRSDAGIYYCAVVMCGDILFGNGTQLDIEGKSKLLLKLSATPVLYLLVCVLGRGGAVGWTTVLLSSESGVRVPLGVPCDGLASSPGCVPPPPSGPTPCVAGSGSGSP